MSTSNRIIKNTVFLYMRTLVSLLLGVFTTRILLEALGESDFGLYNVVGGTIAMMGFLSASLSSATQRFLSYAEGSGNKEKIRQYFNNAIIIHWGLAFLMILVFTIAGLFFFNGILNIPEGKYSVSIVIYICLLISTIFSITIVPYEAEINAHENMFFFSILGISDVVVKFGIAFLVLYVDSEKLILYAILMSVESFLLRFVAQVYCKSKYEECREIDFKANFDKKIVKEMTSFAGWNMANIATGMISLFGMNVVVNHYFGTDVNAAMGIATQLSGVMMGLSANLIKAVTPAIVKSEGSSQHDRMLEYTYVSCKFSYLIFSFVCIPVLFYIGNILDLWLTIVPKWTPILCIILIVSTLLEQLTAVLYQTIMAVGNIKLYNIAKSIANIAPLCISIAMFQYGKYEPYWIFINWGIFKVLIGGGINLIYARLHTGLDLLRYFKSVVSPVISCSIMSATIIYIVSIVNIPWGYLALTSVLLTIPVYYYIALNNSERNRFRFFVINVINR